MIELFLSEQTFEVEQKIREISQNFSGEIERIDGEKISLETLADILSGGSLFGDNRLIIVKNLSENAKVFEKLPDFLTRNDSQNHVILVEKKIDKRSKIYKLFAKNSEIFAPKKWTEYDDTLAEKWTLDQAKKNSLSLDGAAAKKIVQHVGVDQWQIFQTLQKLAPLKKISLDDVERFVEKSPRERVFDLFSSALSGDESHVQNIVRDLRVSQDPYMLQGLLASQAFQLAALALAEGRTEAEVAKKIGAQPFALRKLATFSRNRGFVREVLSACTQADIDSKSLTSDVWLMIERSLSQICAAAKQHSNTH